MNQDSAKNSAKLLEYLCRAGTVRTTTLSENEDSTLLLSSETGARYLTTPNVLDALHKAALIVVADGTCSISSTGKLHLRRALKQDDLNDPGGFGGQHRKLEQRKLKVQGAEQIVTINANESPLSRLMSIKTKTGKPWLEPEAFNAAEKFRTDFTKGQFLQRVTASWDPTARCQSGASGGGGMTDMNDSALDARSRVDRALDLVGPELAGVLTDVCCFLKGLQAVEKERNWPPRSAKLMLRVALNLLARHYGTASKPSIAKQRNWMEQGAKPIL